MSGFHVPDNQTVGWDRVPSGRDPRGWRAYEFRGLLATLAHCQKARSVSIHDRCNARYARYYGT